MTESRFHRYVKVTHVRSAISAGRAACGVRPPQAARAVLAAALVACLAVAAPVARAQAGVGSDAPPADAPPLAQRDAQAAGSPLGLWRSIDDGTKQPKALIRITAEDGVFVGRIERILTERTDAVCDLCTDERKDQPVQGMRIVDGMRASADEPGLYEGGRILDPQNGKVYRSRMRLVDGGERLEVRGYVGAPLFGRTQTWIRER